MNERDVRTRIGGIAKKQPVFDNEKDFQYSLAHEIEGNNPDCILCLEGRPLRIREDLNYDIYMHHEGIETFIELKYKPAKLDAVVDSRKFHLKNQSAQDLSSYDFLYDVWKLEQTLTSTETMGFAIFLTNDSLYWRGPKKDSDYYPFRLEDKRVVKGGVALSWLNNREKKGKKRQSGITLRQSYTLDWKPYATIENGEPSRNSGFKYLLLAVGKLS